MSDHTPPCWALIPAAGAGRRMGGAVPKQYLTLGNRAVIGHTLSRLCRHGQIDGVMVVLSPEDSHWDRIELSCSKPLLTTTGGAERADSVLNGLDALATRLPAESWILVHDAARPCVRADDISRLIGQVSSDHVGGLLALPVRDTMKRAEEDRVSATVDRAHLWHALTPQMFRLGELRQSLRAAISAGHNVTDEASAMEWSGHRPLLIQGHEDNIKITRPADLELAALYLAAQKAF